MAALITTDENPNQKVFIDDLNKIRLANPEIFESSNALKTESEQFIENLNNFKTLVNEIQFSVKEIGTLSDQERLRALNAQNELRRMENAKYQDYSEGNQHLRILLREKQVELERLKIELQSYKNIQAQQREYLQKLRASFTNT